MHKPLFHKGYRNFFDFPPEWRSHFRYLHAYLPGLRETEMNRIGNPQGYMLENM